MKKNLSKHSFIKYKELRKTLLIMKSSLLIFLMTIIHVSAFALTQNQVSGVVTDSETGETIPGVSVVIQGTTIGTITSIDGVYMLSDVPDDAVLVFSYVGMTTRQIPVEGRAEINVTMEYDVIGIEEVVAIGYGTALKSDLTGSVATAPVADIKDFPTTGIKQAMAGQLSGVQIQQSSGEPGSDPIMRIRGVGSMTASAEPLFVVDGFVGARNINNININDIESIEVLKDASAAAIYGSRGSGGVVLITTKQGDRDELRIEANMYTGVQQLGKKVELMNASEWVEFHTEARDNSYIEREGGSLDDPISSRPAIYQYPEEFLNPAAFGEGTDWQDAIFRTAPVHNFNLSMSGGTEKSQFFASGNYFNQDGIIMGSGLERYSLRLRSDTQVSDKVKIGVNLAGSNTIADVVNASGHWGGASVIQAALNILPILPVYEPDGTYGSQVEYGWGLPNVTNPVRNIKEFSDDQRTLDLLAVAYAEIDILEGLIFRATINSDLEYFTRDRYNTSNAEYDGRPAPNPPLGRYNTRNYYNLLNENMLTYSKVLNERHSINAVVAYSAQKSFTETSYMTATDYPNDLVRTLNAGIVTDGNTSASEWTLLSYLGRFNYNFDNKYYLTASLRRDGSSRFGADNKWGTFPSMAVVWRIAQEDFMETAQVISELKIRTSYGSTGNFSIPNYGSIGLLGSRNYVIGDRVAPGLMPSTMSNEDLGWEKTNEINIGLDVGLFRNRVFAEFDYYDSETTDLLLSVPVPAITGFNSALTNIGAVSNKGWEVKLTTHNIVARNFNWTSSLNASSNKNEVLALGPEGDPIYSHFSSISKIGYPIASYFGYIYEGVYNTQEEIDATPSLPEATPGSVIVKDVDGDGEITADDRTIIGDNYPDLHFGINNKFIFNNFDLSIFLQGVYGYQVYRRDHTWNYLTRAIMNVHKEVVDRWRSPENPGNGRIPQARSNPIGRHGRHESTLWVQDGDFLRISNITLGYNLPANLLNRISVPSARIYFQVQNLYTFTDFPGYDPEVSYSNNPLESGASFGGYPSARTFTFGINMSL